MVSKPGFDANLLSTHNTGDASANYKKLLTRNDAPLINRAIGGDLYAPGSVFKLVVASAAIESGKYTAQSKLPNPRTFT
ncbi:MAG: penicillin-binding protein 2, partial [Microbacteriaceae bacterium]|nr:penicillin-binding protein 2 [Microbacteriaceae bacterium]